MKYLIDTDWAIDYLKGETEVARRLEELREFGFGMSVITLAELYEGIYYSRDPEGKERGLKDFLRLAKLVGIDEDTCRLFGRERGRLRKAKKLIGDMDIFIGVTARRHGLTVLTNNRKRLSLIEGVTLESIDR